MLIKNTNSIHNGTAYVSNYTKTFYYSPKIITKTEDNNSIVNSKIVPNPANTYFTIIANDNTIIVKYVLSLAIIVKYVFYNNC